MTSQESSGSVVIVRARQPGDLDACAAALIQVHHTDGYPVEGVGDPRAWLMPAGLLAAWIGELAGDVVGHILLTTPGASDDAATLWRESSNGSANHVAVLGRLFVVPKARGRATGEQLVRVAMEHAQQQGLRLLLDVMKKDQAAIRLYERLGWQRIGATVHRSGDDQEVPAYCYVAPLHGNAGA